MERTDLCLPARNVGVIFLLLHYEISDEKVAFSDGKIEDGFVRETFYQPLRRIQSILDLICFVVWGVGCVCVKSLLKKSTKNNKKVKGKKPCTRQKPRQISPSHAARHSRYPIDGRRSSVGPHCRRQPPA